MPFQWFETSNQKYKHSGRTVIAALTIRNRDVTQYARHVSRDSSHPSPPSRVIPVPCLPFLSTPSQQPRRCLDKASLSGLAKPHCRFAWHSERAWRRERLSSSLHAYTFTRSTFQPLSRCLINDHFIPRSFTLLYANIFQSASSCRATKHHGHNASQARQDHTRVSCKGVRFLRATAHACPTVQLLHRTLLQYSYDDAIPILVSVHYQAIRQPIIYFDCPRVWDKGFAGSSPGSPVRRVAYASFWGNCC